MELPKARVTHRVPGRMRLRIAEKKQDRAYFESLRKGFEGVAGVRKVTVNPVTSSVLVETRGAVEDLLEAESARSFFVVADEAQDGRTPARTLVEKATEAYDDLDASLRRTTEGAWDLKSAVFVGLLAGGVVQVARGKVLPASVALFNSALLMLARK